MGGKKYIPKLWAWDGKYLTSYIQIIPSNAPRFRKLNFFAMVTLTKPSNAENTLKNSTHFTQSLRSHCSALF
jgi:hypothetical protein